MNLNPSRTGGPVQEDINYCQRCGGRLVEKELDNQHRPHCENCGYVVFLDPKVAAVVLVSKDRKLVMVRRAIEPAIGRWSFPSGYVDRGEVVEDAARREVKEETGIDVELTDFVGLYSRTGSLVILAAYAADAVGGTLNPGSEAQEVALFSPAELPPLPFPHDDQIIQDWTALKSGRDRVRPS